MNKLILLIISFYPCLIFSQKQTFIENDTIITWSEDRALDWKDFIGKKPTPSNNLDRAGTSYTLFLCPRVIEKDEYKKFNVVALFFKDSSWTISNSIGLLAHEQLHFNIAELYARKLRKCYNEMKEQNVEDVYLYINLHENYELLCLKYQELYDEDTNHGKVVLKQIEWQEKVANELKELEKYKYEPTLENIEG